MSRHRRDGSGGGSGGAGGGHEDDTVLSLAGKVEDDLAAGRCAEALDGMKTIGDELKSRGLVAAASNVFIRIAGAWSSTHLASLHFTSLQLNSFPFISLNGWKSMIMWLVQIV